MLMCYVNTVSNKMEKVARKWVAAHWLRNTDVRGHQSRDNLRHVPYVTSECLSCERHMTHKN